VTWTIFWQFIGLLPAFYKQFMRWQAEREEESYQEYVDRREQVIAMLKGSHDAKSAFEAAVAARNVLRSGK
jgi:hypothetical protein